MTDVYLPLYEAKMLSLFDDRFQTHDSSASVGPRHLTLGEHDDPTQEVLPRYWIPKEFVDSALAGTWDNEWLIGWRDIARSSDYRTFISAALPRAGVGDTFLLATTENQHLSDLAGVWCAFVHDFVTRNMVGGTHVKFFTVRQLACPTPSDLQGPSTWQPSETVVEQLRAHVRELSFTSWQMSPFAQDMGDEGPPFRWIPARREQIRAEFDAMLFHVYGLDRDEVDYVLDTFTVLRKYDERDHGEFRTKRLILEFYDLLVEAIASGVPYRTLIDPPPGFGPRHPESTRPAWMKEQA